MELIVISPTKLKIMLTEPDMRRYDLPADLTNEIADRPQERTRQALRKLFAQAHQETGFETEGARLLVQLYASRAGGCEIFVTRLGDTEEEELSTSEQALLERVFRQDAEKATDEAPPVAHLPATTATRTAVLRLEGLDSLLAVCRRLSEQGYGRESSAYILDNGEYCLFLAIPDTAFFRLPLAYAFLTEYGREGDPATLSAYLSEHGQVLCAEGAVERLGELG